MPTTYYRRFRMDFDLVRNPLPMARLPIGYDWVAWEPSLANRHAAVKHVAFREEVDARVFRCLGDYEGCLHLMRDIARQASFLPGCTWLVSDSATRSRVPVDCGTIQGLSTGRARGAVQNVGVTPGHRGRGLGRALVAQALRGFRRAGIRRVTLEVTADNEPAVELYRSLGFRTRRTLYKPVDESEPLASLV